MGVNLSKFTQLNPTAIELCVSWFPDKSSEGGDQILDISLGIKYPEQELWMM